MDLKDTYNRIAADWNKDHSVDEWWIEGVDHFISLLAPESTVLDVGCGSGVKAKYLSEHGLTVTGVDFADKLLEIAKENAPRAKFQELSMYDLDSMTETFDAVFAQASLLHIPKKDIPHILKQCVTRVNAGGYVYVAVKEIKPGEPDESVLKESDYGFEFERFFSYFTMQELEDYFVDAGLTVVWKDSHKYGRTTWLQIIGKKS